MTAYASNNYSRNGYRISIDLKSVNGKSLEVSLKSNFLKPSTDLSLRDIISRSIRRGTLEISINIESVSKPTFVINKKLAKEIKTEIKKSVLDIKNISFSDIKDIPGIFMDTKSSAISENITKDLFKRTLEDLILSKEAEGKKIKSTFNSRINKINRSLASLTKQLDKNKNKRKKNIYTKLKVMDFDATNESISNEVVNQIIKSDISEEIDRLNFHITSLADELNSKNARGKKIDFILLEMLREANTILAKTTFSSEKKYGLIIKILIEEMREQVGNVE